MVELKNRGQLLASLQDWCKQHHVKIRWCDCSYIQIVEKTYPDPITDEWADGDIYVNNLMYIDQSGHIHHGETKRNDC